MRHIITLLENINKPSKLELPKLSYTDTSLVPVLSSSNIKNHIKLWQGYSDRFNNKEGDQQFNYSGYILHNLWFSQFRSPRNNNIPNGPIGNLIISKYKSWDNFKEEFEKMALTIQGSGWCYLARDGMIKIIRNHDTKTDIVILVDMWEHAYFNDYGSNKKKYLNDIWKIIDWGIINSRYMMPYRE